MQSLIKPAEVLEGIRQSSLFPFSVRHCIMPNMQEYWEAYDRHPHLQGGFIWDWVDQGLINTAKEPSGRAASNHCSCMKMSIVFYYSHQKCQRSLRYSCQQSLCLAGSYKSITVVINKAEHPSGTALSTHGALRDKTQESAIVAVNICCQHIQYNVLMAAVNVSHNCQTECQCSIVLMGM